MLAKAIKDSYIDTLRIWRNSPENQLLRSVVDKLQIDYIVTTGEELKIN